MFLGNEDPEVLVFVLVPSVAALGVPGVVTLGVTGKY